jgi:hypothetical protein
VLQVVIDCCGSVLATGIRADRKASLEQAAARCEDARGLCECVARPTVRDDGSNAADEMATDADCVRAQCSTRAASAEDSEARN